MHKALITLGAMAGFALPAQSASLTLSGIFDAEDGSAYAVDGRFEPVEHWSIGAGAGHSQSRLSGSDFSGSSQRLSTDIELGDFTLGVSGQRWKDSGQLKSTAVLGEIGWMGDSGLSVSALLDDRSLAVVYTATVLGQTRERSIDFDGTGVGADISWFGETWSAGLRFLDYSYGRSVDRVRAVLASPGTTRFPRLQLLVESAVTRAAGAPDRELSASLSRQLHRSSLHGDWVMQRDALTGDEVNSLSMTLGYEVNGHVEIHTTVGFSNGGATDTMAWGGLALTLRR